MKINTGICCLLLALAACTSQKKLANPANPIVANVKSENAIEKAAQQFLLNDSNLAAAHLGISIYDPAEKKYLYNYQGDKYFIPASNTKLLTCYAAMKYLGDSLVGLRVQKFSDSSFFIQATADPTFLHPDFKTQPVLDFLQKNSSRQFRFFNGKWNEKPLGFGWAWDDYSDDYMVERSSFPIFGNVIRIQTIGNDIVINPPADRLFPLGFGESDIIPPAFNFKKGKFTFHRYLNSNELIIKEARSEFKYQEIPFITNGNATAVDYLKMVLPKLNLLTGGNLNLSSTYNIHSQPTDSLLKITMHRSDNFFAEQTLLMVSNERLGMMSDVAIIDTLLKTDYKAMPQKPKWVDGSGLSRYNLISPQDFVFVLEKMKNEFAWNRITTILPTGNSGTLGGLYKNYAGKIYAKTGTVSNNLALSGYIITNQNKQLIFSVIVNNHQASASAIRRSIEKFITDVIDKN